ncbi:MAG: universal stress protein [Steroidobacteraceae bacterium]
MKSLRRILVAIKDPKARRQLALRKAAQLAAGSGARLELFHAIATPMYMDAYTLEGQSLRETQRQWRARALQQLEKLAAPLREQGLAVTVGSVWDFPAYEAVIRRAQQVGAELIVAERHATRHVLPWLLRFNDWELLRRSPVPVLLLKRAGSWRKPAVLAAIDPSHGFAKPAKLDHGILTAASTVNAALGGKLQVAHAWPGSLVASTRLSALTPALAATLERRAARDARTAFAASVERSGITVARQHFVMGSPVDAIPRVVRKQRAGIVVMGAVSRSGLKRLVVGNVAEQILDALPCDVLVVKPAGFKARVPAKGRGVQLIPTPAY